MPDIFATLSFPLIQLCIAGLICCELLWFTEKTIYKDFPKTKIKLTETLEILVEELDNLQLIIHFNLSGSPGNNIYITQTSITKKVKYLLEELKNIPLTGNKSKYKYSLFSIYMAYKYLSTIRLLGSFIVGSTIFNIILLLISIALKDDFNIDNFIFWGWIILFFLDVCYIFIRGMSRVCNIIYDFNDKYKKTRVLYIVLGLYMI